MPPGPAYNWFAVLSSTADILSHAARYRAAQLSRDRVTSITLGKPPSQPVTQTDTKEGSKNATRTTDEVIENVVMPLHERKEEIPSSILTTVRMFYRVCLQALIQALA